MAIPSPHTPPHDDPEGNGVAVAFSFANTTSGVSDESTDFINDTMPLTWGAAMLVPLLTP